MALIYLGDPLPPGFLYGSFIFGGVWRLVLDFSCILATCGFPESLRLIAGDLLGFTSRWDAGWSKMRTILGDLLAVVGVVWAGLGLFVCRRVLGASFYFGELEF